MTYIWLTVKIGRHRTKRIRWPVVLPHHLISAMWEFGPAAMEKSFPMTQGSFKPLWDSIGAEDWSTHHPCRLHPHLRPWALGYRIHGDGFRCFQKRKALALGWSAAGASGNGLGTYMFYTVIPTGFLLKKKGRNLTMNTLVETMVDSFNCLADGIWPTKPLRCRQMRTHYIQKLVVLAVMVMMVVMVAAVGAVVVVAPR